VAVVIEASAPIRASAPTTCEAWRLKQKPGIDPRGAAAEAIAVVVRMCPSG
jgi:uncharacterized Fe-S cluster protein YjdI